MDVLHEKLIGLYEQQKEEVETKSEKMPPEKPPVDAPPTDKPVKPPVEETPPDESGGDESEMGSGDESMNDVPPGEDEQDQVDSGKIYELKQLYNRMIAIRNHLEIFVEEEFDEVKASLTKVISFFEIVINNYDKYADRIDEIIILFYQFLLNVYEITKKKYKKYSRKTKKVHDQL